MLDLADLLVSSNTDEIAAAKARIKKMTGGVFMFALVYGLGAVGFMIAPAAAFSLPAILAAIALFARAATAEAN